MRTSYRKHTGHAYSYSRIEVDECKYEIYKRIIEPATGTIDVHRFMVAEHRGLRREDRLVTEEVQRSNDGRSWST